MDRIATIEECVEVYKGNYSPIRQYASSILLKMLLGNEYNDFMDNIKEELGFKINNRYGSKARKWAKKIKKIGKCEICDSTEKLVAHHIIPWEYSITGRFDLNNGQCLCTKCHKMMHDPIKWVDYMRCCYGK